MSATTPLNRLAKPVIIACSNLKGGEGKTTISRHLVLFAAEVLGLRVLAADFDPQGNLTDSLRGPHVGTSSNTAELFGDTFDASTAIAIEVAKNISLLPSDLRLEVLAELDGDRKTMVTRASANLRALAKNYDVVIVDTPTNAPVCYLAGLASADFSISPVQMDSYGLRGAVRFQQQLQRVRATYNARHRSLGFVVNRYKGMAASHKETLAAAKEMKLPLLQAVLGDRVAVQDSLARATPVWRGPRGRVNRSAAREFKAMCSEVFAAAGVVLAKVGA